MNNTEQNNDNLLNENILQTTLSDNEVIDIDIELNGRISSTSSSEQCAICLDPIEDHEECINNCGHKFCKPCMDQYLDLGKIECPLCRQPIQYFEYNSEHFRLILKKVNETRQNRLNPNELIVDRKKYMIYRFVFIALFTTNIVDMFMSNIYTAQQNLLLEKYNECEKNNTDLNNDIVNLENTIDTINTVDDDYGYYLIADKIHGLQSECYLPTNLINQCFNIF